MSRADTAKKKKIRWSSLILVGVALFCVVHLCGQIKNYFGLLDEINYYKNELVVAQEEYDEQISRQDLLNNDAYIERLAREKLGMVKRGESVVSVVEGDGIDENNNAHAHDSSYDVDANPE